jgi:hypothetical protein
MRTCWAKSLGNCSDSLSGEHLVSAGLFATDTVCVQGLSWCRDEPKTIGLPNLTRNILCTSHNSALSPVDEAAIKAFNVFRECVRLTDVRQLMKERLWNIVRLNIDGAVLERWFLKTLVNVTVGGPQRIGPKSLVVGEPSEDLVEIAYGLRKFKPNAGLYSSAEMGETLTSEDRVTIIPFFDTGNECVFGGTFYFRGFRFMLYLGEEGFTGNLSFVHRGGAATSHYSRPLRHLRKMNFTVGPSQKRISHVVDFKW